MKASIAHGIRPSALILGKDSKKPWGETDIQLAKAYQRYLAELCPQCGYPKYMCHTDDNRIQFEPAIDDCASARVAESQQAVMARNAAKKNASQPYGKKVMTKAKLTEDAVAEGLEFSDFRRPYLIDQAKKAGLIPQDS